ncbi:hypothetical protein STSP2_03179 [Anaerohalosphaera lusitana]|uniref:Uncharacterized protein n=1 Tax=Anaerohalosphaera lusitana TaxID=1936003 RepID=A0A1U9NPZ6_9BACT|nr:hypothetical protein [Anaerohalosphaera lusitana]AQT69979.1 hypothetical protein STSP2_03179 [Anaerohalosphaera lusitana]
MNRSAMIIWFVIMGMLCSLGGFLGGVLTTRTTQSEIGARMADADKTAVKLDKLRRANTRLEAKQDILVEKTWELGRFAGRIESFARLRNSVCEYFKPTDDDPIDHVKDMMSRPETKNAARLCIGLFSILEPKIDELEQEVTNWGGSHFDNNLSMVAGNLQTAAFWEAKKQSDIVKLLNNSNVWLMSVYTASESADESLAESIETAYDGVVSVWDDKVPGYPETEPLPESLVPPLSVSAAGD